MQVQGMWYSDGREVAKVKYSDITKELMVGAGRRVREQGLAGKKAVLGGRWRRKLERKGRRESGYRARPSWRRRKTSIAPPYMQGQVTSRSAFMMSEAHRSWISSK